MKDPYIKIRLSELTRLNNRIVLLEQRLHEYEPAMPEVKLLNSDGTPRQQPTTHPLRKPGPKSVLEILPDTFTRQQAYDIGATKHCIKLWKWRKYITTADDDKFTKTDMYLERIRQAKLTNLSDDFVVNKIKQQLIMVKLKSIKTYIENLWLDIEEQRGERPRMLRHLVEKTAKDQRHLDLIDGELKDADMTTIAVGSTGQQKTEINPLLAHRDKVSRTITEDLKELQLTAGSVYKKKEQVHMNDVDKDNDPTSEYFGAINN